MAGRRGRERSKNSAFVCCDPALRRQFAITRLRPGRSEGAKADRTVWSMKYRWTPLPEQPLLAGQLAKRLGIVPLLAQCLINRGLSEAEAISAFLEPRLRHLADPFLIPNMSAAVERLLAARSAAERVIIFGDYDVDGVTSTTLLLEVLRRLGWTVDYYLPHRRDEGYGLSREAAENCAKKFSGTLWVAVDCGSTSVETIATLKGQGIDVIVVDHHQVSSPAPEPVALVNPLAQSASPGQNGEAESPTGGRSKPPFTELCSVGLSFKLAHALVKRGRQLALPGAAEFDLRPLLDLVALGTVADLVPLSGENRILVAAGLKQLNQSTRPGLIALKRVAHCPARVGVYEAGFQLAPRLNAAGRLETAESALRLLLAGELAEALPLAANLDAQNRERQTLERGIAQQAIEAVTARFNPSTDFVIVEGQEPWHIGVVGIVAARVLQQFYRPTIIVGGDGVSFRGSGRSIAGFDLAGALHECGDLLMRHGGHAMAAGVSLAPQNLEAFRSRLNAVAHRTLTPEHLQPALRLDGQVGLEEVTLELLAELARLDPVGQGNPSVHFFATGLTHSRPLQRIGSEKQHVKMWVTDGQTVHEAVWWGGGNLSLPVGRFDLAFAPQTNEYNGRRTVQLKVLDWRGAEQGL
jgi:single-stranded-DNA-specific exonuclease